MGLVPLSLVEKKLNLAEGVRGGEGERYFKAMELSMELCSRLCVAGRGGVSLCGYWLLHLERKRENRLNN